MKTICPDCKRKQTVLVKNGLQECRKCKQTMVISNGKALKAYPNQIK